MADPNSLRPIVTRNRTRSASITQALNAIPLNEQRGDTELSSVPASPLTPVPPTAFGETVDASGLRARKSTATTPQEDVTKTETLTVSKKPKREKRGKMSKEDENRYKSEGFWKDLKTGKWMLIPTSCLPLLIIPWLLYFNHRYILTNPNLPSYLPSFLRNILAQLLGRTTGPDNASFSWSIFPPSTPNPMQPFLFLSGAVQKSAAGGMGKMGDGSALTGETLYKRDIKVGNFPYLFILDQD
ncbi:hypothetical protein QFC22_004288 [Naganishia vaughanmartiniae]|uniref:Uncharacterized protein n=1 Tax=Naganishia vaughanmartiniae TaxID=1424756 RepID=A0ACC2X145_9TREE|nr:hypothetical protein QFC22_004288 [Naganishia vaughanmartiniae]